MTSHIDGRERVLGALRAELFGPDPNGTPLDTSQLNEFDSVPDSYGPWVDAATGEEILQRDRPMKRYGIGVLYPAGELIQDATELEDSGVVATEQESNRAAEAAVGDIAEGAAGAQLRTGGHDSDPDDFDLTAANQYKPSAMALSLLIAPPDGAELVVRAAAGRYRPFPVRLGDADRTWWRRQPVSLIARFPTDTLIRSTLPTKVAPTTVAAEGAEDLDLELQVLGRPSGPGQSLITVAFVNRSIAAPSIDERSIFQVGFEVTVEAGGTAVSAVAPYPDHQAERLLVNDEEARSIALLYRGAPTFAIGHGCAADWDTQWGDERCVTVRAEALPSFETPSITPDIELADGTVLEVPMGPLAGLEPDDDGFEAMQRVIDAYDSWIQDCAFKAAALAEPHRGTADAHVAACREALARMRDGIEWLSNDVMARRAFVLANRSVLYQQLRTQPMRTTVLQSDGRFQVEPATPVPDWRTVQGRGSWRAFQIGFLLAAMRSSADRSHADRDIVELIFFPTGGGKTEAYQGLAAFCLFYQRLHGGADGVGVVMRYTLRLLTAQQFLRAAALVCAMERIRLEEDLPGPEFSIGIWVGESATPTRRDDARRQLNRLGRNPRDEANPFLLLRCPWCAAQMGPVGVQGRAPRQVPPIAGYATIGSTVAFRCPDPQCEFRARLPVYVIDEDIYEFRPSIVIGTVDKFAMLAWRPQARRLFGIAPGGEQAADPPNLIIQDELHLISGPLGSMVGLYEGVIEELCTDRRGAVAHQPKIVGSTATIRRYRQQIKGLYGRERAALFPPHGLDAADSFFARYARDRETGALLPGRKYVGVHAPGLGSIQTAQVRTFASLLQAGSDIDEELRDPWWSLLVFFNSLRELGTSVSLLQSDIPDYLLAMRNRRGANPETVRRLRHIKELTSRLRQDEIPQAIDDLEKGASDNFPVDVCLASNIIEVGIDIPRLSLMCVVGQPKSTSQYIQVTGRVGRLWKERPGLVVTIYGASKPRDRSHFERFRPYHERLYAQVEPVSVTPFAQPVLKRALHAVLCTYARQVGPESLSPWPFPELLIKTVGDLLSARAALIDPDELEGFKRRLNQRIAEWKAWERNRWESSLQEPESAALLRRAGQWVPPITAQVSWPTPMSMRDVDAECRAEISTLYAAALAAVEES